MDTRTCTGAPRSGLAPVRRRPARRFTNHGRSPRARGRAGGHASTTTGASSPAAGSPITDGLVRGRRRPGRPRRPRPARCCDADGCLVTPGLINTHHHIYQNLTRAYRPGHDGDPVPVAHHALPAVGRLDEEAAYVSAWVGPGRAGPRRLHDHDRPPLRPPARRRRPDHRRDHAPRGSSGMRFHPTRGSMSLSQKDGGLPPDSVVQDDDEILADSERLVGAAPRPVARARWCASRWRRARRSR